MPCQGLIRLRRATVDDARSIASVHVDSWREAYDGIIPHHLLEELSVEHRETFWRGMLELTTGDHRPWVAENDDGILGFVDPGLSRDDDADAMTGEIYAIYVEPDCQGRGIGRDLLSHALHDLKSHGFQAATMWCHEDNDRARRLYERSGWRFDGTRRSAAFGQASIAEVRYVHDLI